MSLFDKLIYEIMLIWSKFFKKAKKGRARGPMSWWVQLEPRLGERVRELFIRLSRLW